LAGAQSEAVAESLDFFGLDFFGIDISLKQIVGFMNIAGAAIETLKRNLYEHEEPEEYIRGVSVDIVEGLQEIFSEVKGRASDIAKEIDELRDKSIPF